MAKEKSLQTIYEEKLFSRKREMVNIPVKEWSKYHLVLYFMQKYSDYYHVDYEFSYSSTSVAKCKEVSCIAILSAKLSSDPEIQKRYIDFVFETQVPKSKRRLTAMTFLLNEFSLKDFKTMYFSSNTKKGEIISRSSEICPEWKDRIKARGFDISTYGQLHFYLAATDDEELKKIVQYSEWKEFVV